MVPQIGHEDRSFEGLLGRVDSIASSPDGRRFISSARDGTIRVWSVASRQPLVTLLSAGDDEWVALTLEGVFAASPTGAHILSVVRGLQVFGIECAHKMLNYPDLVHEKLAGDADGKVRDAAAKLDLTHLSNRHRELKRRD